MILGVEGGVTKCQTDRRRTDQTTTSLVTDAGAPEHIVRLSTSSTFISTTSVMDGSCYPRLRALCRFWALTAPSGRCGTVGDLPLLCHNRWDAAGMRGPRCILGSSLHIFQHFHSKCERPWNLAPGTTVLRCRAAAPRITLL